MGMFKHLKYAVVTVTMLMLSTVFAATWDGAGNDDNWSNAGNWGGIAPITGEELVFSGIVRTNNNNDLSNFSVAGLIFNDSDWVLDGNVLNLTGSGNVITGSVGKNVTISMPLLASTPVSYLSINTQHAASSSITLTNGLNAGTNLVIKDGSGTSGNADASDLIFKSGVVTTGELRLRKGGLYFTDGVQASIAYLTANEVPHNGINPAIVLDGTSTVVNLGSGGLVMGSGLDGNAKLTVKNGATLNSPNGQFLLSLNASAQTTIEQTGGIITAKQIRAGFNGKTTFNLNGGSLINNNSSTSFLTDAGSCTVNLFTGWMIWGANGEAALNLGNGKAVLNLNRGSLSGKLKVGKIVGNGEHIINFNAGTLIAGASSTTFLEDLPNTKVLVSAGGAIIDSNGFDITISEPLQNAGGGLTKKGLGVLRLDGANTYPGPTTIDAGTLSISSNYLNPKSILTIADGAMIDLDFTGTNIIRKLVVDGVEQAAGVYDNGSDFITGSGTLTVQPAYVYDVNGETMTVVTEFTTTDYSSALASDNTYTPLATFNGNTYFVWVDSAFHPWVTKINDQGVVSERLDDGDDYVVREDSHDKFSLGIDKYGYIHVVGDMHNHSPSIYNDNLPQRYRGSNIMYWVSSSPEDISSFDFTGFGPSRAVPGHAFTYCSFTNDMNMELFMSCRNRDDANGHYPGMAGFALFYYDADLQIWTARGGYAPGSPAPLTKMVLWENNGNGDVGWYQSFANTLRFDRFNRLHFAATINNDPNSMGSSHIVYAYSDDGGLTFHRVDGGLIANLPMRVDAGTDQASVVDGPVDNFSVSATAYTDANGVPFVTYWPTLNNTAVYRYWNQATNTWSQSIPSPAGSILRVMNHLDPNGVLTFVNTDQNPRIVRATDLQLTSQKLHSLILDSGQKYLSSVDQLALRNQGIFRFVASRYDQSALSVMRVEFSKTGGFTHERWEGVTGTTLSSLAAFSNFPDVPDSVNEINGNLEITANSGNDYGRRLRGFIHAPQTGDYTFYVAGDNHTELWLSTNTSVADASRIAYLNWYTSVYQWDKYASQQSQPIQLFAGQKYYFEVLQKEGGGDDHVQVAWDGPGIIGPVVIDAAYLSPWANGSKGALGQ